MFNMQRARAHGPTYLLLLGADPLLRERAIVSALRTYPGLVVGMNDSAVVGANRFFDHILPSSPYNAKSALAAVEAFEEERGFRPDAVVPVLEMNLHVAATIAEHYGLPRLSEACISRVRDKHTMKVAFEEAGIPCARHHLFSTLPQLREAAAKLGFPLVLKPRDFAGSVGIIRVDAEDELPAAFDHCRASLLEVAPTYDFVDGRYQAEAYVRSTHEVSVEVFNYEDQRVVLAVTDKSVSRPPFFAETGQQVPSRETGNAALRALAVRACEALLIDRGVAHVEVLLDGPDMQVVEVAARPGGDGIMDLVERVYGFSPYDLHLAAYRGTLDRIPAIPRVAQGIGATAFLKAPVGTIVGVRPPQETEAPEVALYVTARPGDRSRAATSYLGRDGVLECFEAGATEASADAFRARTAELAATRSRELFDVREEVAS